MVLVDRKDMVGSAYQLLVVARITISYFSSCFRELLQGCRGVSKGVSQGSGERPWKFHTPLVSLLCKLLLGYNK